MVIRFSTRLTPGADQADTLRLLTFGPGANNFLEDDFPLMGFDGDAVGVDFRAAAEGFLDLVLDLASRDARFDLDRVGNAIQALHPPHSALGRRALIVPLDLAFEGDPAIAYENLDLLGDDRHPVLDRRDRVPGDFGIGPLVEGRQAHLDVVRHAEHAGDPLCGRLRLELVAVTARKPGEGDDPALYRYCNVG